MLKEPAEIGMELARVLLRRAAAKAACAVAGPDPQLAFARVSRAVRQIVALNAHPRRQQWQPVAAKAGMAPMDGPPMEPMDPARRERVLARAGVSALLPSGEGGARSQSEWEAEGIRPLSFILNPHNSSPSHAFGAGPSRSLP
ncbi:MAG TPA: hypothetical protein VGI79_10360 [Caulobacteraceae bacterium]